MDGLSILNRPQVTVVRDGEERQVKLEELVEDDVMVLESGMQICNDAEVIMGELEVNESLLTGESDGVAKAREMSSCRKLGYFREGICPCDSCGKGKLCHKAGRGSEA